MCASVSAPRNVFIMSTTVVTASVTVSKSYDNHCERKPLQIRRRAHEGSGILAKTVCLTADLEMENRAHIQGEDSWSTQPAGNPVLRTTANISQYIRCITSKFTSAFDIVLPYVNTLNVRFLCIFLIFILF